MRSHFWKALSLFAVVSFPLVLPATAQATHNDDECHVNQPNCTPDGNSYIPFNKPKQELAYILAKRSHLWKNAWRGYQNNSKAWAKETYDPRYINPTHFLASFEQQCQNKVDWDNHVNNMGPESATGRYQYSVDGVVQVASGDCFSQALQMKGQGIHDVKLEVFAPGAATPYLTKTEDVRVRDYLVVLFGDSAASGEGAPEMQRGPIQERGEWIDKRCHRSSKAAVPLAVEMLEDADPHSTVTFIDFACSGATLKYWEKNDGSGILGRYAGIEKTPAAEEWGDRDPSFYLLSQVDQLFQAMHTPASGSATALPTRNVDMLLMTGGINDVRFAKLALTCILEDNCDATASSFYAAETSWVGDKFDSLAADIPAAYVELKDALVKQGVAPAKTFVMQYPGAFENDTGALCTSMLGDVLPPASVWALVSNPILLGPVSTGTLFSPLLNLGLDVSVTDILKQGLSGDLAWTPNEIDWLSGHAMPELDRVVRKGAQDAGFNFVGGIKAAFAKHGYCATTNWIIRAQQSSDKQGPWDFVSKPLNAPLTPVPPYNPLQAVGFDVHAQTKGLMHPNYAGYEQIAKVLKPVLGQLINRAPTAKADTYSVNTAITPVKFDTGFGAGLLLNDNDPDGDPVRSLLVTGATNGTATLSLDGRLVYVPNPGFSGTDSVYYTVTDGGLTSASTKVTLSVGNPRDPASRPTINLGNSTGGTVPVLQNPVAQIPAMKIPVMQIPAVQIPVVQIGGFADFPVCSKCGDSVVQLDPRRRVGFGRVSLARKNDQWIAHYVHNGLVPPNLPYVDTVSVSIGRNLLGVFTPERSANISVRIEGTAPPPR